MSYTTLIGIGKDGTPRTYEEYRNAWGGAAYIWTSLIDAYLVGRGGATSLGAMMCQDENMNGMKPLWELGKDLRVPENFRFILLSTFDRAMVRASDFNRLADAMDEFVRTFPPGDRACSLPAQAQTLRQMALSGEWRAACWHQTSVSENPWIGWDEEKDESIPYNIDTGEDHFFIFDGYPLGGDESRE